MLLCLRTVLSNTAYIVKTTKNAVQIGEESQKCPDFFIKKSPESGALSGNKRCIISVKGGESQVGGRLECGNNKTPLWPWGPD